MNLKKDLKDIGYYLITPIPAKYHFEGVDNHRAARNLTIVAVAMQVVVITLALSGPAIGGAIYDVQTWIKTKKTDRYNKKN